MYESSPPTQPTHPAEQSGHLQVPVLRRQDQGRGTILPRLVLVGASLAEQSGHLQVPAFRRSHLGPSRCTLQRSSSGAL